MDCPARCLRSGRSIIEPHADTVGAANAVIDDAVLAAAADSRDVGRRRVEGVVDRAIKLDMVVPAIGAAEVAIDHRRHIVVVDAGIEVESRSIDYIPENERHLSPHLPANPEYLLFAILFAVCFGALGPGYYHVVRSMRFTATWPFPLLWSGIFVGLLSLAMSTFTLPIAISAGIFYGVAGIRHVTERGRSLNETVAMASDLFLFMVLAIFVAASLTAR